MVEENKEQENPNVVTLKYWTNPKTGFGAHLARTRDGSEKAGRLEELAFSGTTQERFLKTQEAIRQQMISKGASYEEVMGSSFTPVQVYGQIKNSLDQSMTQVSFGELYQILGNMGVKLEQTLEKDLAGVKLVEVLKKQSELKDGEKLDPKESAALALGQAFNQYYFSRLAQGAYSYQEAQDIQGAVKKVNNIYNPSKEDSK